MLEVQSLQLSHPLLCRRWAYESLSESVGNHSLNLVMEVRSPPWTRSSRCKLWACELLSGFRNLNLNPTPVLALLETAVSYAESTSFYLASLELFCTLSPIHFNSISFNMWTENDLVIQNLI